MPAHGLGVFQWLIDGIPVNKRNDSGDGERKEYSSRLRMKKSKQK